MRSPATIGNDNANQTTPAYAYILSRPEDGGMVHLTNWQNDIVIKDLPAHLRKSNPQTFTAAQVQHSEIVQTGSFENRATQVALATEDELLKRYFTVASAVRVICYIIRLSTPKVMTGEELDYAKEGYLLNSGIVAAAGFKGMSITATVTPEPFLGRLQVPRFYFSRGCNRVFGGPGCGVNVASFARTTTIAATTLSQRIITLPITPPLGLADYFRGGRVVHLATGQTFGINWCDGGGPGGTCRVSLTGWGPILTAGQNIQVFPGCRHTTADCSKYGNQPNYGGFPFVPNRNPTMQGVKPTS